MLIRLYWRNFEITFIINPKGNHNQQPHDFTGHIVVYIINPTGNHNSFIRTDVTQEVISIINPKGNHNYGGLNYTICTLFLSLILQGITTRMRFYRFC